jgi:hypothetical protein
LPVKTRSELFLRAILLANSDSATSTKREYSKVM